jgi:formate hydrogenlyase subunit 4
MVAMSVYLYYILNPLAIVLLAPLALGVIKKIKAFTQGRSGPPVLQAYRNLAKLFRKEIIYAHNASFISALAPILNFAFLVVAALAVPVAFLPARDGFGNIILFVYLLASARFFMALSGLDAGSAFGGMGSSREMSLAAVVEPVTIAACAAMAFVLDTSDIPSMFARTLSGSLSQYPTLILVAMSLFIILVVETARVPVDNPETHLELTMVHEAMILEQSGPNLALLELSYGMKHVVIMALLINTIFPLGLAAAFTPGGALAGLISFILKMVALCVVVGVFESGMAKIRLFRLPAFFTLALFFAFVTIVLELLT